MSILGQGFTSNAELQKILIITQRKAEQIQAARVAAAQAAAAQIEQQAARRNEIATRALQQVLEIQRRLAVPPAAQQQPIIQQAVVQPVQQQPVVPQVAVAQLAQQQPTAIQQAVVQPIQQQPAVIQKAIVPATQQQPVTEHKAVAKQAIKESAKEEQVPEVLRGNQLSIPVKEQKDAKYEVSVTSTATKVIVTHTQTTDHKDEKDPKYIADLIKTHRDQKDEKHVFFHATTVAKDIKDAKEHKNVSGQNNAMPDVTATHASSLVGSPVTASLNVSSFFVTATNSPAKSAAPAVAAENNSMIAEDSQEAEGWLFVEAPQNRG